METWVLAISLVVLAVLDIAALLWGVDSRKLIESEEWQRRAAWCTA